MGVSIVVTIFITALCLLNAGHFAIAKYQDYKTQKDEQERISQEKEKQTQLQLEEQKALEGLKQEIITARSEWEPTHPSPSPSGKVRARWVGQAPEASRLHFVSSKHLTTKYGLECLCRHL